MKKMKEILRNKYFKYGVISFLYLLWTIWVGNWWLLLGLPVIYDMYISKKVHWSFWKKRNVEKQSATVEWIDALIFAVIAASLLRTFFIEAYTIPTSSMEKSLLVGDYLFVSKVAYGPKLPNTPLSFPFAHHTLPFTKSTKSFLEWIKMPYKRLAGFGDVKRNDSFVFNFPEGDTVVVEHQDQSYYALTRMYGRDKIRNEFEIIYRPVDKRENYIKRCVAVAGDKIEVRHGDVYINGAKQDSVGDKQYRYRITTNGTRINPRHLEKIGISHEDMENMVLSASEYILPLTYSNAQKIKMLANVISVIKDEAPAGRRADYIFPHNVNYNWNEDNFGPLQIPARGMKIELTTYNLPLFRRIIETYEGNKLRVEGDKIFINGKESDSYTFKMNYYFAMGDNRHNSADSRFWGVVPEDHVVGKPAFVWLSLDKDKSFLGKIRWSRFFMFVD